MAQRAATLCTPVRLMCASGLSIVLSLSACQTLIGDGSAHAPEGDAQGAVGATGAGAGTGAGAQGGSEELRQVLPRCGQATAWARASLETYCAGCHGASSSKQGGFSTVTDVAALIADGKVTPGDPDGSLLMQRIASGAMPPAQVQTRPSPGDTKAVQDWIACGAPDWNDDGAATMPFVGIDARLHKVLADVRAFPNPLDRTRLRYLDLSALANAGYSKSQLQVYREALAFLLNSLSHGHDVIVPQAVDEDALVFRIDLRDYLWDAQTWHLLELEYPYGVVYDQNSRLFPFDEVSAAQIRKETDSTIPIIQVDWFLSHAGRPPLYAKLLELPATLGQLQTALGVNIAGDIAGEQVLRAGFKSSGSSHNPGVIERHDLGGDRGALWINYHFASSLDQRNIFVHPLDFRADLSEVSFTLDNGLLAYFVADAAGRSLDKAPNNIVQDPLSRDGAVENGMSCVGCHQQQGALPQYDEIRDFVLSSGPNVQQIEAAIGLYADRPTLAAAFAADQARYQDARAQLALRHLDERTMHALDDTHLGVLDVNAVAAVLGVEAAALERALSASPQAFPAAVVALRTPGGGVQRDAFDAVIGELVSGLGLGRQLLGDGSAPSAPPDALDAGTLDAGTNTRDAGSDARDAGAPSADAGKDAGSDAATNTPDAGALRTDAGRTRLY